MKRTVKQVLLLGLLALVVTAVVCWPTLLRYLIQSNLQNVRKQGTPLSWSGLSTGATSVAMQTFTAWIPGPRIKGNFKLPLSLELHNIALNLRPTSLLLLRPTVTYAADLYGGTLRGETTFQWKSARLDAKVTDVEIGRHPQIASLGVRGGILNGTCEDIESTPAGPRGGRFTVTVREITPPTVDLARSLLRVDELGSCNLEATGTITPDSLDAQSIHVTSSFGEVSGNLTARQHLSPTPTFSGRFTVSLSEKGSNTFSAWLPLIPGAGLDGSVSTFIVTAESTSCSQRGGSATVVTIGTRCVKLVFARP
jgi:hypothetical protein